MKKENRLPTLKGFIDELNNNTLLETNIHMGMHGDWDERKYGDRIKKMEGLVERMKKRIKGYKLMGKEAHEVVQALVDGGAVDSNIPYGVSVTPDEKISVPSIFFNNVADRNLANKILKDLQNKFSYIDWKEGKGNSMYINYSEKI